MISAVSGSSAGQLSPIASISSQANTPALAPQRSSTQASDSVQLSPTAQAVAMKHTGMSVKQIASNMGTTVQTVNSYLGISTTGAAGKSSGNVQVNVLPASTKS